MKIIIICIFTLIFFFFTKIQVGSWNLCLFRDLPLVHFWERLGIIPLHTTIVYICIKHPCAMVEHNVCWFVTEKGQNCSRPEGPLNTYNHHNRTLNQGWFHYNNISQRLSAKMGEKQGSGCKQHVGLALLPPQAAGYISERKHLKQLLL